MSATGRRRTRRTALLAVVVVAAGLAIAQLLADAAVERARADLLAGETAVAAQLLRETGRPELLERLLPGRWTVTDEAVPGLDLARVERGADGLAGRAALYDAEGWDVVGTLTVAPAPPVAGRGPPAGGLPLAAAVLAAWVLAAAGWRAGAAPGAGCSVGWPCSPGHFSSRPRTRSRR